MFRSLSYVHGGASVDDGMEVGDGESMRGGLCVERLLIRSDFPAGCCLDCAAGFGPSFLCCFLIKELCADWICMSRGRPMLLFPLVSHHVLR